MESSKGSAPASNAAPKDAKMVVTLNDIKFNEEGKTMAILSCIPVVGLIMFFVERNNMFVRYTAAQYMFFTLAIVLAIVPVLGWCLSVLLGVAGLVLMIMGMVKISSGERYDVPVFSEWAIKAMNAM